MTWAPFMGLALGATVGCDLYDPAAASGQPGDLPLAIGVLRVFVVAVGDDDQQPGGTGTG